MEASATRDSAMPASLIERLPRIVCTAIWKAFPFDHSSATSTASPLSCTGMSASCSFISETVSSCVQ